MSAKPDYYAEIEDPGSYEERWLATGFFGAEAKAKGCNVTRTLLEDGLLKFEGWIHPANMPPTEGIRRESLPTNMTQAELEKYEGDADAENEQPTAHLRFVYKDGRYQLQTLWYVGGRTEWRDVPIADETQP